MHIIIRPLIHPNQSSLSGPIPMTAAMLVLHRIKHIMVYQQPLSRMAIHTMAGYSLFFLASVCQDAHVQVNRIPVLSMLQMGRMSVVQPQK